jgi:hypothetical protein
MGLGLCRKSVYCKIKLLIKYIYRKQQIKNIYNEKQILLSASYVKQME